MELFIKLRKNEEPWLLNMNWDIKYQIQQMFSIHPFG